MGGVSDVRGDSACVSNTVCVACTLENPREAGSCVKCSYHSKIKKTAVALGREGCTYSWTLHLGSGAAPPLEGHR